MSNTLPTDVGLRAALASEPDAKAAPASGAASGADCRRSQPMDYALQQACAAYWAANVAYDRLLAGTEDAADAIALAVHRKWIQALSQVLEISAESAEGEREKSAVLRSAVEIVLGRNPDAALTSEMLAPLLPSALLS